jgi:8-oxo-dGTP diphosphatase
MKNKLNIPQNYYRVSVKGIEIKNHKILLVQEEDGHWELPGGGLDHGEEIHDGLRREVKEEMGVGVKSISQFPIIALSMWFRGNPRVIIGYKIKLNSYKIRKSEECVKVQFFTKKEIQKLNLLHPSLLKLTELL